MAGILDPVDDWKVALRAYFMATFTFWVDLTSHFILDSPKPLYSTQTRLIIQTGMIGAYLVWDRVIWKSVSSRFGIAWRAYLLGSVFNLGSSLVYHGYLTNLGWYMILLSFFHWSEFMTQSLFNPTTTKVDSFMLYHSDAYVIAAVTSWLEFAIEYYYFPGMKGVNLISIVGIVCAIIGEALRKLAMWTAKSNFNHYVQMRKIRDHELVTTGVYAFSRHPSYVGWFLWSASTQLVLKNPVCVVLYTIASWKFFSERIYEEEQTLISFFGQKYIEYQKRVGIRIPFIKGFTMEEFKPEYLAKSD